MTPATPSRSSRSPATDVVELPGEAGRSAAVAFQSVVLGFAERHVDGWHPYVQVLLDRARIRHVGNRAVGSRCEAVDLIVGTFTDPSAEIVLRPDGFQIQTTHWTAGADQRSEVVALTSIQDPDALPAAWHATVTHRPGSWLITSSPTIGYFDVWFDQPRAFVGSAASLYDAALLTAQTSRSQR